MNFNIIPHGAGSAVSLNTYAKALVLMDKTCNNTKGYSATNGTQWNCNRCGNDKEYLQPVNPTDTLFFQFNQSIITANGSYWKGQNTVYTLGAVLVAGDGTEVPMETFDNINQGGSFFISSDNGSRYANIYFKSSAILAALKTVGYSGCRFSFKFNIYVNGSITQTLYVEDYTFIGCQTLNVMQPPFTLHQCQYTWNAAHFATISTLAITQGTIFTRSINFALNGLTITCENAVYLLNQVFPDLGIWYVTTVSGTQVIGIWGKAATTQISVNGNNLVLNSSCTLIDSSVTSDASVRTCITGIIPTVDDGFLYSNVTSVDVFFNGVPTNVPMTVANAAAMIAALNTALPDNFFSLTSTPGNVFKIASSSYKPSAIITGININTNDPHVWVLDKTCRAFIETEPEQVCFDDCRSTMLVEGVYEDLDCDNYVYDENFIENLSGTPFSYRLLFRLFGKVTLQGSEIEQEENTNSIITSVRSRKVYRLLGSPIPPYVAEMLNKALTGKQIIIDGVPYIIYNSTSYAKKIDYSNMWALDLKIKSADCLLIYGCDV